ncbi:MAG: hypothetical protein P1V81_01290 [Planctomycetota bacterium]|nr:hypothetical protein [Planctomycetota bacterium]
MKSKAWTGILLFCAGILTAGLVWFIWPETSGASDPVGHGPRPGPSIDEQDEMSLVERTPVEIEDGKPLASRVMTLGDYLIEEWGSRWPEIEAQLAEADWDLDSEIDLSKYPSWEEVEPRARALALNGTVGIEDSFEGDLRGLYETVGKSLLQPLLDRQLLKGDPGLNPEGKPISRYDYDRLKEIEDRHTATMAPLLEAYLAANQSYRAAEWELGHYEHGLLVAPEPTKDPSYSGQIESTSGSFNGWMVELYFEVEKDPLLNSLLAELNALAKAKADELKLYIAGL